VDEASNTSTSLAINPVSINEIPSASLFSGLPTPPSIDAYSHQANIPFALKYLLADIDSKWHSNPTIKGEMKSLLLNSRQSFHHQLNANKSSKTTSGGTGLKTAPSLNAVVDPELYVALDRVLRELKAYTPYCIPFLAKVNKKDVPDYYSIIKVPMDLGTMGKKLKQKEYSSKRQFFADLEQIYTNCYVYNTAEDSIYRQHVQILKEKWTSLGKSVPEDKDEGERLKKDDGRPSTLECDDLDTLLSAHLESLSDSDSKPSPKKPRTLDVAKASDQPREPMSLFPCRSSSLMHRYSTELFQARQAQQQSTLALISTQEEAQIIAASKPSFFPELAYFFNSIPDARFYRAEEVKIKKAHSYSTSAAVGDVLNRLKALQVLRGKRRYLLDSSEDSYVERSFATVNFDETETITSQAQALGILEKVCVLYMAQFGFESFSRVALNSVTQLVHQHICNLFRTYRLLHDAYYRSKDSLEILNLTIKQAGSDLTSLEQTILREPTVFAAKISRMEASLDDVLAEVEECKRDEHEKVRDEDEDDEADDADDLSLLDTELEPIEVITAPVDQEEEGNL